MDVVLLLVLILLNGVFAMSEIAVVSSRRARLQRLADEGSPGAGTALALHIEPSHFLSTIQVGITSAGILSGALGEGALAEPLAAWLRGVPLIGTHAEGISLAVVVVGLTWFTVVVGELVPKRLGLLAPEGIACLVARPMLGLSRLARPLVWALTSSSDQLLRLMWAGRSDEPPVTDEEINVLMEQGAEAGVFHESEQEIVSNVLRLDERRIVSIMTHRSNIYRIDLDDPDEVTRRRLADSPYERIVVCRGGLNHVVGVLRTLDLLKPALEGTPLDIEGALLVPLYVPESVSTTHLLESFRAARTQFALIIDEFGEVVGLVTITDVLTAIVGELPSTDERDMVMREDGSWLVDGDVAIDRLKDVLDIEAGLPGEDEGAYHTLGGFIMHTLGRVPASSQHFHWGGLRFEVVDMDNNRVDKVLVSRGSPT